MHVYTALLAEFPLRIVTVTGVAYLYARINIDYISVSKGFQDFSTPDS